MNSLAKILTVTISVFTICTILFLSVIIYNLTLLKQTIISKKNVIEILKTKALSLILAAIVTSIFASIIIISKG